MTARASRWTYGGILAFALLVRLALVFLLPFGPRVSRHLEGLNDEPAHFAYVRYLAIHRALPVQVHHSLEPGAIARGDFEYYQPPLYYLACAPLYALAGEGAGLLLCRLVSFVCGVLSLVVLGRILARLGCSLRCRRLGVLFLALLPSHSYFSSLVSNDSASWLIALLLTSRILALYDRLTQDPRAIRSAMHLEIGLLLALGVLTKASLALFYPILLFAYGYGLHRTEDRRFAWGALLALGLALVLAGPWYLRNIALYGSPFPLYMGFGPPDRTGVTFAGVVHAVKATARYFWFPMQDVRLAPAVSALRGLGAVLLLAHVGAAIATFTRRSRREVKSVTLALLLVLAVAAQVKLDLLWVSAEGRFLFPALAGIVTFTVVPVCALVERGRVSEWAAWLYVCALALHPYAFLPFV